MPLPLHQPSRRTRRLATTLLVASGVGVSGMVACGELASAPAAERVAPLALAFAWPDADPANSVLGADIDAVRIVVSRRNESTAADTTIAFPTGRNEFRAAVDVPLEQRVETLYVYVDMMAGQATRYYASEEIVLRNGIVPALPPLELFYVGPGSDAVSVNLTPRTSFVPLGGTVQFTATAQNGQQQLVTPPIAWSVSDRQRATISALGLLQARNRPGTVWVRALTPNGVGDSLQVNISAQLP